MMESRAFDDMYDNKNDKETIQIILNTLKKYDIYDFILNLSTLNLIKENQNKSILIDTIIAALLTVNIKKYNSIQKINKNEFYTILRLMNNMDISGAIDPPERPFIYRVMFFENYNIFNGINYDPGYILQNIIETLLNQKEDFDNKFINKSFILIKFILQISDSITKKINVNFENIEQIQEKEGIYIPDYSEFQRKKEFLLIEERFINELLENDFELITLLYSKFEYECLEDVLNIDNQKFYISPFLKDGKGKVIVLSPSILTYFLIGKLIILAEKYDQKDLLVNSYNALMWKKIRKYFYYLNNKKINEQTFNIALECQENYKEVLLSGDNKEIIFTIGLFDDGKKYNKNNLFEEYEILDINLKIENRVKQILRQLKKNNVCEEDIFICIMITTFGRSFKLGLNINTINVPVFFSPFELKCISINEKKQNIFLTRYIRTKSKLVETINTFGELPYIDLYTSNHNSFYISDDINSKKDFIYYGGGDYIGYIFKALKKENCHLVNYIDKKYMKKVILKDIKRRIYFPNIMEKEKNNIELLNEFRNFNIWTFSNNINSYEEFHVYESIIEFITYWLGECKEIIEKNRVQYKQININIVLKGNIKEYFILKEEKLNILDTYKIFVDNENIKIEITPETYMCFNQNTNENEKIFIIRLLKQILYLNKNSLKKLERIFLPKEKQTFFSLDYIKYPYFKPINIKVNRVINENDINNILDEVGEYIISLGRWKYGIISNEERKEVSHLVVGYLYGKLEKLIEQYNPIGFLETLYKDLEKCIFDILLFQERQYHDILCYPEKKKELWNVFNDNQRISRALKFLCEYVAAKPPNGNIILGESEYEYLIAICSLIIEWAYNNDLFIYEMFNTPIEILKSGRVGLKKCEYEKLGRSMLNARMNEFNYNSMQKWNELIIKSQLVFDELNKAFEAENGFSYNELFKVCNQIIIIGNEQISDVKKYNYENLLNEIHNGLLDINKEKIINIISYVSLTERENYLVPPKGFSKIDIFPWRFNRSLSFTRRPIIIRKDEVIWGNRNIFHMLMFTLDLIEQGKMKAKSREMIQYLSQINNLRGKAFNDSVYNILKSYSELIVEKNLTKINGKKIVDEQNQVLGDIDILYINKNKKIIVVGETKDFKLSKSPYEIYNEYLNMFVDRESRKSFSTKLRRRMEWIQNNIEDVKEHFGLIGKDWNVYRTFIVNEHLISKDVFSENENIISLSEISLNNLTKLK